MIIYLFTVTEMKPLAQFDKKIWYNVYKAFTYGHKWLFIAVFYMYLYPSLERST